MTDDQAQKPDAPPSVDEILTKINEWRDGNGESCLDPVGLCSDIREIASAYDEMKKGVDKLWNDKMYYSKRVEKAETERDALKARVAELEARLLDYEESLDEIRSKDTEGMSVADQRQLDIEIAEEALKGGA